MCVSRVVLSANNCCGRRPKGARRAVPRLSVPRYKLSLGTDDMGVPSFQPTGETLPTGGCILALRLRRLHIHIPSCRLCGLALDQTCRYHTGNKSTARRVWRWQKLVVLGGGCGPPRISRGSRLGRCDDFLWTARLFSSRGAHFAASRVQHLLAGRPAALAHCVLAVACESSSVCLDTSPGFVCTDNNMPARPHWSQMQSPGAQEFVLWVAKLDSCSLCDLQAVGGTSMSRPGLTF